jgi:hypothetical protein
MAVKPICKNCAAWDQSRGDVPVHGHPDQWGICRIAGSKDGKPGVAVPWAWALDFHGHSAQLETFESFGCVLFEPKP